VVLRDRRLDSRVSNGFNYAVVYITYFVHATTVDNERDNATDWLPGELSRLGWLQAEELRAEIIDQEFDAVFSSDLKRAVDTAETAFGQKFCVNYDPRLREVNYGDWNGSRRSSFVGSATDYISRAFPGGESYRDVETRMRSLCNDLKSQFRGQRVALLAHQAPQLALEVICNGRSWAEAIEEDWRKSKAYRPGWCYIF
jgi:broad specificity phosphatase PhoE